MMPAWSRRASMAEQLDPIVNFRVGDNRVALNRPEPAKTVVILRRSRRICVCSSIAFHLDCSTVWKPECNRGSFVAALLRMTLRRGATVWTFAENSPVT